MNAVCFQIRCLLLPFTFPDTLLPPTVALLCVRASPTTELNVHLSQSPVCPLEAVVSPLGTLIVFSELPLELHCISQGTLDFSNICICLIFPVQLLGVLKRETTCTHYTE